MHMLLLHQKVLYLHRRLCVCLFLPELTELSVSVAHWRILGEQEMGDP